MERREKVAVVTGAASGIGRATVERLHRGGWAVMAADVDLAQLEEWASVLDGVRTARVDVTSAEANERLVAEAVRAFGGLDAAVLNAGVGMAASVESMVVADMERVLAVNLLGPLHGIRAALPALRQSAAGSIVVTASMNGLGADQSMSAYTSSKFGVVGLVKAVCREVGFEGIRVNAVCPGVTHTGMTEVARRAPAMVQALADQVPLGRWAEADEVASVIEFLVSPAASYVNGVALPVDGGASTGVGLKAPARAAGDLRTASFG